MTQDQIIMRAHWHLWGWDGLPVSKVKGGWIIVSDGVWAPLGHVPKVFKTKREACAYADNLAFIRVKEWTAADRAAS